MKLHIIYYYGLLTALILVLLCSSCTRGNREVSASLDRIEQVVGQHPDSALAELVRLDSLLDAGAVCIEGDRQMARYALLKTQTRDKNYIDDTNDSLIMRAVRYYDEHGSKREQMLAHYYLACIFRNSRDFGRAYSSYLYAAEQATELENHTIAGMAYGNIASICRELYSGEDLLYTDYSYHSYQLAGDSARMNWALMQKGIALNYQNRYNEAEAIFERLLHVSSDLRLRKVVTSYYIYQSVKQSQYKKADSLIQLQSSPKYVIDYLSRAIVSEMKGQQNEADSMMQFAARSNSTVSDKILELATIATLQNNRKEYYEACQTLFHRAVLQDSIVRNLLTASVSNIQSNYELHQKELAEYRYAEYKRRTILASAFFLLLMVGGVAFALLKRKEQQLVIDAYMENVSVLEQTLLENSGTIAILQNKVETIDSERLAKEVEHHNQIKTLFAKGFHDLDALCSQYYNCQGKIDEQRQIYKKVQKLIEDFVLPPQQEELERFIDSNFNHAIEKARSSQINLSEEELELFRYRVAGFSIRSICLLTHGNNREAIKKRIQRLKRKIIQSNSPSRDEIASLM